MIERIEAQSPASHARAQRVVLAADLAGTFVFGLEGALAAIGGHLDLFGVMVLAFATALGGGVFRDLLMGYLPPAALRGWTYAGAAFAAAAIAFAIDPYVQVPPRCCSHSMPRGSRCSR